ncbi:Protein RRP5-like protein [Frankliniella fusca]|uniref:Protein RRP5-like protein n=1 Tax=Frankliniella fusca TaxID=407009 RepID=A0AAE1L7V9_9NEOP|nr:Protein RRP5-like protein [Frankliniella fusca]
MFFAVPGLQTPAGSQNDFGLRDDRVLPSIIFFINHSSTQFLQRADRYHAGEINRIYIREYNLKNKIKVNVSLNVRGQISLPSGHVRSTIPVRSVCAVFHAPCLNFPLPKCL